MSSYPLLEAEFVREVIQMALRGLDFNTFSHFKSNKMLQPEWKVDQV